MSHDNNSHAGHVDKSECYPLDSLKPHLQHEQSRVKKNQRVIGSDMVLKWDARGTREINFVIVCLIPVLWGALANGKTCVSCCKRYGINYTQPYIHVCGTDVIHA